MPIPVLPISGPTSPSEGILKREESSSSNLCRRNSPFWFSFKLRCLCALSVFFYLVLCSVDSAPAQSVGSSTSSSSPLAAVDKIFEFNLSSYTPARASSYFPSPTRECIAGGFFFDGLAGSDFASHHSAGSGASMQCVNVDINAHNSSDRSTCVEVVRAAQRAAGADVLFQSHLYHADVSLKSIDRSAGSVVFLCLLLLSISLFWAYFARAVRIPASPSPCCFRAVKCKSMHKWTMRAMFVLIMSTSPFVVSGINVSALLMPILHSRLIITPVEL